MSDNVKIILLFTIVLHILYVNYECRAASIKNDNDPHVRHHRSNGIGSSKNNNDNERDDENNDDSDEENYNNIILIGGFSHSFDFPDADYEKFDPRTMKHIYVRFRNDDNSDNNYTDNFDAKSVNSSIPFDRLPMTNFTAEEREYVSKRHPTDPILKNPYCWFRRCPVPLPSVYASHKCPVDETWIHNACRPKD
ncbi:putative uncharacterized protein DDB_G0287457 [Copidosoma floridanum]|uniref:putative uncharacterized protein DDB_G0287457 n=1 Tax=Copidosoma floridanum TaxID=29053 RepID=UPI0006C9D169|nr:putative uncharacterized protein DDB_G0287457 [Copidosoma floridanum]